MENDDWAPASHGQVTAAQQNLCTPGVYDCSIEELFKVMDLPWDGFESELHNAVYSSLYNSKKWNLNDSHCLVVPIL